MNVAHAQQIFTKHLPISYSTTWMEPSSSTCFRPFTVIDSILKLYLFLFSFCVKPTKLCSCSCMLCEKEIGEHLKCYGEWRLNSHTCINAKNIAVDDIMMRFLSTHSSPAWTHPFSFIVRDISLLCVKLKN